MDPRHGPTFQARLSIWSLLMERLAREIDDAIFTLHNTSSNDERRHFEEIILGFRNAPQPYDLCKFILANTQNTRLVYEVGKCLSNAAVREWTSILDPPSSGLVQNVTESQAGQLLCFLLQWVASASPEIQTAGRQSILSAASALVKRAAAEQAQTSAKAWRSSFTSPSGDSPSRRFHRPTLITRPADPGPPAPLMTFFVNELSGLLELPATSSQEAMSRVCFGLSVLSAFLNEMSNTGDFTRLNLPLEAHVFIQARFQSYELLEIFRRLLHLTDTLLHDPAWPGDNFEQNETVYRLVHCLEMVMSWNFLPDQIIEESSLRCCMGRENPLRPSDKWECVFGSSVLPSSLALLLNLHARLRSSPTFGSRTLACIVQLSNIQGPLVTRLPSVLALSPEEEYLLADSAAIVMDCVSRWFPDHSSLPPAACSALLLRDTHLLSPGNSDYRQLLLPQLPAFRVEELVQSANSQPATAAARITALHTYELPLLAELAVNLLRRLSEIFALLERVISDSDWSNGEAENAETLLSRLLFYLSAGHKFFLFTFNLLTRCLLAEARQDCDVASDTSPAHEASERLFAYLAEILHFPRFDGEDGRTAGSPGRHLLPLTTGPKAVRDQMIEVLKQACCQLKTLFLEQQTQLLKLYFAAHLASPVGFRCDDQTDCEELDLSIDEDDQCSFEDSLYAVGHFASASSLDGVVTLLANLLEERIAQLLQMTQTSNGLDSSATRDKMYALMEDLHWILLICGHVLVSGPSQLGSSKGGLPSWDSDFMIRSGIWSVGAKQYNDSDVAICKSFLFCAMENAPLPTDVQSQAAQLPSLLRLFSVLFRLFRLQASSHVGSAQLTEDSFWLASRLAITYLANSQVEDFSGTQPDTPSPPSLSQLLIRPPGGTSAAAISTFPSIVASLVVSTRLAMATWIGEPKITSLASCLLSILARHSLQQLKNTTGCPPWMEFCNLLCSREAAQTNTWTVLPAETLTELIDSCIRGCWSLRHSTISGSAASPGQGTHPADPFFQFLDQLKNQIEPLVTPLGETVISTETSTKLVSCLAAVCGLTRAFRWIAASSEAADLISWLWTAIFMPVCQNAVTHLFQRCHMCHEVTLAIIGLLYEMADNCLVYLADCPAATNCDFSAFSAQLGESLKFKDNLASAQFFIFSIMLCAQYASANARSTSADSDDQQRFAELRLFMELLNFFLGHEFELRLYRDPATEPHRNGASINPSPLGAVDVTIICLGYLLPLLTESILREPDFCSKFYSLVSYALELRAEGLVHLSDSNVAHLGRLVRLGLFQGSDASQTSVSIGCLEVITCLTDCCLDVITSTAASSEGRDDRESPAAAAGADSSWRLQLPRRIIANFPLDKSLFSDLFCLVLGPVFSAELETYLSTCLLALIHLNPSMFDELVKQWVVGCPNEEAQHRLQSAFLELSEPLNRALQSAKTSLSPLTGAVVLGRPSRTERVDFQQLFHSFVLCVRAFLCNF